MCKSFSIFIIINNCKFNISLWWIHMLFIINTKFNSRNEVIYKITQFSMNSLNFLLLYKSWIRFQVMKSSIVYKENILHLKEYYNDSIISMILSIDNHLYFWFIIYSLTIDLFKNMNWLDYYSFKWIIHSNELFTLLWIINCIIKLFFEVIINQF